MQSQLRNVNQLAKWPVRAHFDPAIFAAWLAFCELAAARDIEAIPQIFLRHE